MRKFYLSITLAACLCLLLVYEWRVIPPYGGVAAPAAGVATEPAPIQVASLAESSRQPEVAPEVKHQALPDRGAESRGPSGPSRTAAPPGTRVPVLLYHHLDPRADGVNGAIITPKQFEWEMDWLERTGHTAVTTGQLAAWLAGTGDLPALPVLITFDDGYRSDLTYALPILKAHGMRAALFMIGSAAGDTKPFEFLSWAELKEMQESGVFEIQAHSFDAHHRVDGRPALLAMSPAEVRQDAQQLADAFREHGLRPADAYAYPFGEQSPGVAESLRADGMRVAFTVRKGYVQKSDPPMLLNRFVVYPGTSNCEFMIYVNQTPRCS